MTPIEKFVNDHFHPENFSSAIVARIKQDLDTFVIGVVNGETFNDMRIKYFARLLDCTTDQLEKAIQSTQENQSDQ